MPQITFKKAVYIFIIILLVFAFYYFFIKQTGNKESLDPLSCQFDDDCTYYSPLNNCYRAEPINKEYKSSVLQIIESENTLCGNIKSSCINYQCAIKR